MNELLLATNPDPASRLGYLLRLPLDGGMVFRTSGTCGVVSAENRVSGPEQYLSAGRPSA